MNLTKLDHVNIRTTDLDGMIKFYEEFLGLQFGSRPAFSNPGAWLYCGTQAVVHLVEVDATPHPGQLQIEHFAFAATGMDEFLARLDAGDVAYRLAAVPGTPITQVNLHDPDGNHLHVDFDTGRA